MLSYSALMAAFDAAAAVADTAAAAQYSSAHIDAMKAFCICITPGFPTILRSHDKNLLAGLCCGLVRSIQVGPGVQLRACGNTHYVTLCPLPPTTHAKPSAQDFPPRNQLSAALNAASFLEGCCTLETALGVPYSGRLPLLLLREGLPSLLCDLLAQQLAGPSLARRPEQERSALIALTQHLHVACQGLRWLAARELGPAAAAAARYPDAATLAALVSSRHWREAQRDLLQPLMAAAVASPALGPEASWQSRQVLLRERSCANPRCAAVFGASEARERRPAAAAREALRRWLRGTLLQRWLQGQRLARASARLRGAGGGAARGRGAAARLTSAAVHSAL